MGYPAGPDPELRDTASMSAGDNVASPVEDTPVEEPGLEEAKPASEKLAPEGISLLRWLTIVLPLIFISGLNYLLHTELEIFHDFPEVLGILTLVTAGIAAFSYAVFGIVARLERRVLERNAMLAALVAVGREANSSLDVDELLANSLSKFVDMGLADAAEVWLLQEDGELVLAHHRGMAPDTFRERVRLRLGEGLPGLAAEQGSPIVVNDVGTDQRIVRKGVREFGFESFCALPLRHGGETYGALCVAACEHQMMRDEAERDLLEGVAARLAAAIENSRLHGRVLDSAVLKERERIAHELHDGLAQVLGYINTQTLAVRKLLDSGRTDEAGVQLEAMEQAAKRVYADVREKIFSLRTPLSERDRLSEAVRAHLRNYREMAGAPPELDVVEEGEVPNLVPPTEIQLMWIVREALTNIRNHARAGSATVRFSAGDQELIIAIEDDGRGFRPEQRVRTGWPHFGLQTMRERAEAVGGRFEVDSDLGRGTVIRVRVPLARTNGGGE